MIDHEKIMKQWSSWRKYIAEDGGGSWPRDAFESLICNFEELIPPNSISRFEYDDLLEKIRWYFEITDAMSTVHRLLLSSKSKQTKRFGAYRRLAIMAEEVESDLRELIK